MKAREYKKKDYVLIGHVYRNPKTDSLYFHSDCHSGFGEYVDPEQIKKLILRGLVPGEKRWQGNVEGEAERRGE